MRLRTHSRENRGTDTERKIETPSLLSVAADLAAKYKYLNGRCIPSEPSELNMQKQYPEV